MDAIDWPALARGALWVVGLSISMAALSHVRWAAKREGIPLRTALSQNTFLAPFYAGLALFAGGLAWGATALWERLAWVALAVVFAVQAGLALRGTAQAQRSGQAKVEEERT